MSNEERSLYELAGRIYDLDEEVYADLGLWGVCTMGKRSTASKRLSI